MSKEKTTIVECVVQSSYASERVFIYIPPKLWGHPDLAQAVENSVKKVFKEFPDGTPDAPDEWEEAELREIFSRQVHDA